MSHKKEIRKIDTNLFSGSSDTLRTSLGIYYKVTSSFDDDGNNTGTEVSSSLPIVTTKTSLNDVNAYELPADNDISYVQVNADKLEKINTGPITRLRVPVRVIGNESKIENSTEWAVMLQGGAYGNKTYEKIFSANTYDVYNHNYETSYTELQRKQLLNAGQNPSTAISSFNIGYNYQLYLPEYQNKIVSKAEKELPNMYFNQVYSLAEDSIDDSEIGYGSFLNTDMASFINREGTYDFSSQNLHTPKEQQLTETPPPFRLVISEGSVPSTDRNSDDTRYQDMSLYLRNYLTGAFISNDISDETKQNITQKSSTLYFTSGSTETVLNALQESAGKDVHRRYPMQARLKIPVLAPNLNTSSYSNIIRENKLEEEVLSYIKGTYSGGTFGGTVSPIEFAREQVQITPDLQKGSITQETTTSTITDSAVDVPDMLLDIAQNPDISIAPGEMFITPDDLERDAIENINSSFRYTKTIAGMKALQKTLKKMNSSIKENYEDEITSDITGDDFTKILQDIKSTNRTPEVIAYRIQKIGGRGVGIAGNLEKIQDVFFFNNGLAQDGESMYYYDTQVKYGQEYTYSVYAYMLIPGIRYRYSNLKISKNIGEALTIQSDGSFAADSAEPHCIEFYDPSSGAPSDQLLNEYTNLLNNFPMLAMVVSKEMMMAFAAASTTDGKRRSSGRYAQIAAFFEYLSERPENAEAQDYYNYIYDSGTVTGQGDRWIEKYNEWALKTLTYTPTSDIRYHGGVVVAAGTKITMAHMAANRYATNAQIKAANKYLADFHFEIEPTLKIIQVPITSKYFTIMDHPPVACDIIPYQRKDNSQIIGFQINRETFPVNSHTSELFNNNSNFGLYPTPISPQEQQIKENYLLSNNMLENEIIKKPSVSPPDKVDVYRIDKKPTSLSDFNNNLVYSVRLQYEDDLYYNYNNCIYEEAVATNKVYYYLFKFVNENGMTGYISPIQVAELIDDGGYKYAKFDVLFENNLKVSDPKEPTIEFKKLIQIMPASRHTDINQQALNASMDPLQLIEDNQVQVGYASSLIWDKKFKFRLTSKKTGRKIDLNITYKLRNS